MTIAGTGTLTINAACALTPGVTFTGSVSLAGTTVTLGADWTITGSLTSASGTNVMNGNTCYIGGSLTATVALSGTTLLVMNGTGTLACASGGIYVSCNLTVNTAGTITIGPQFCFSSKMLTWAAGTLAGTGLLYIFGTVTLNTSLVTWPGIYFASSITCTMTSDLKTTTYLGGNTSQTFVGAYDFYVGNFHWNGGIGGPGVNFTFPAGQTIYVSDELDMSQVHSGQISTMKSGAATSAFNLNYAGTPALCRVWNITFTDVDASGSTQEIKNYNGGTLTRCTNIKNVNLPVIPSSVSIGG
jgi:hypothetical protein